MQTQINNIEAKVDKLFDSIVGSDLHPNGFIQRMDRVEAYQDKDKKQKYMFMGGTAVLTFLFNLWQKLG